MPRNLPGMARTQSTREPWRWMVGYPYRWQGVALIVLVLGLVGVGLALTGDGQLWRWIAAVAWLTFGVVLLLVSVLDRRHSRGRYNAHRSSGR